MNDPPVAGYNDPSCSQERHKDFDNSANSLWSLYTKEVKSLDEVRIQSLKDDMDGILLFVCTLFPPFMQPELTSFSL